MSHAIASHMKASIGRLGAALFIRRRARCYGAGRHGGKAPVDSLLFTTKPAIDALILVLVAEERGRRPRVSKDGPRARERYKRPMVRDARFARSSPWRPLHG